MGCLSVTSGFRSIIAKWSWSVSSTVCLEIPAGSAVTVVNVVLFDIFELKMLAANLMSILIKKSRESGSEINSN